jgi:hypothetical protein
MDLSISLGASAGSLDPIFRYWTIPSPSSFANFGARLSYRDFFADLCQMEK